MTKKIILMLVEGPTDKYLKKNPFVKKKDILKIVRIIDTDGAFISNSQVR